jgi:hypothetical protein
MNPYQYHGLLWECLPFSGTIYTDRLMLPDSDNCFGRIKPRRNLHALAAQLTMRGWQASVQTSQSRAGERLRVESSHLELHSESSEPGEHIFDGVVDTDRRGESAVAALSDHLQEMNIPHHFELYDESDHMYQEFKFEGR